MQILVQGQNFLYLHSLLIYNGSCGPDIVHLCKSSLVLGFIGHIDYNLLY